MAVVFMLLVIIVQLAFVLVAHEVSQSAVDAAARRAARDPTDIAQVHDRLVTELEAVVPGAQAVDATITAANGEIEVVANIHWAPPGPDLVPVVIHTEARVPQVVPP